jgi:hypothetical protein
MNTTITISNNPATALIEIRVNDTLIGTVKDGNTILKAIERELKANGCIRITGYSPSNGNLVAEGMIAA